MQGVYWHAGKGMSSIDQAFNAQIRLPSLSNYQHVLLIKYNCYYKHVDSLKDLVI